MADLARSIFVCYRRDDTRHLAGRLRDRLSEEFGPRSVFMDVETIGPGADFTAAIDEALSSCRIVLVLIGQVWLTGTDASGRRRITDPDDHVALEIATALRHSLPIVPILADGARMPGRADLPPLLAELATRNAVPVDHETFDRDSVVVVETVAATLRPYRRAAARRRLVLPLLAVGLVLLVALGVFVVLPALRSDKVVERVLTGEVAAGVSALTTAVREGRPVAIAGDSDGTIRVWDLLSGEPVGSPLTGHTDYIYSLSTTQLDGRTVIVSSGYDATIRVWDLVTGAPAGPPRTGSDAINLAATDVVDGRPVVITTTNADRAVVVDLATDQPVGPPLTGHEGGMLDAATGVLDGRPVVVTVDGNEEIGAWDLGTLAAVGGAASCTGSAAAESVDCSIAVADLHRQPVVVVNDGAVLRASYLATGEALGGPVDSRSGENTEVVAGRFDGRPIVVARATDGAIQVWDLEVNGFTAHGAPIAGPTEFGALAVTEVGTDPILLAGGADGSVHVWNLHTVFGS